MEAGGWSGAEILGSEAEDDLVCSLFVMPQLRAFAVLIALAAVPAEAQNELQPWGIGLQLGPVVPAQSGCEIDFRVYNRLEAPIDRFAATLVARDRYGPVDRVPVEVGPVEPGRHDGGRVEIESKEFQCRDVLLVEVVLSACEIEGSDRFQGCLALMRALPRGGRPLVVNRNPVPSFPTPEAAPARADAAAPLEVAELGATVAAITATLAEQFAITGDIDGAVVVETDDPGAEASGIQAGDVIVEVEQEEVASAEDVARLFDAARAAGQSSALVLLNREGEERFIVVPLQPE